MFAWSERRVCYLRSGGVPPTSGGRCVFFVWGVWCEWVRVGGGVEVVVEVAQVVMSLYLEMPSSL